MFAFYWFLRILWSIVVTPSRIWKNRGHLLLLLHLSRLCTVLVKLANANEKDTMAQGRKDWKPQNPSKSGMLYPPSLSRGNLRNRVVS